MLPGCGRFGFFMLSSMSLMIRHGWLHALLGAWLALIMLSVYFACVTPSGRVRKEKKVWSWPALRLAASSR
jgi:hypothetical protein